MNRLRSVVVVGIALFSGLLQAQVKNRDVDAGKSVAQVEMELAPIARELLYGDSTDLKIALNKEFITRLTALLQRPESYDHPFDSLQSISRLQPRDDSFRIFTWYLVDRNSDAFYAEAAHYYFGLVQRKFIGVDGKPQYLVIPLMEMEHVPKGMENLVTDNLSWFGALYYPPKGETELMDFDGFYYKLVPKEGEMKVEKGKTADVVTFVPGRYKQRIVTQGELLAYSNHTRVKQDVRYYMLMGWNGWDSKANYKVVDVMTFDPDDSMKVHFGAPVFYFDQIPKARALFKYSEYASFSLNTGYVKGGPFNMGKKKMIVYDHLAPPKHARPTEVWDMGPDGTYDGLSWYKRTGGYFEWYRKVETADKFEGRRHAKEMAKLQAQYAKADTVLFPDYYELSKQKGQRKVYKVQKRQLDRQRKEAEQKLKDAGIKVDRIKEEEKEEK